MVNDVIFVEGSRTGPNSKDDQRECREAFKRLFIKCGFSGRLPRIFAAGSRISAYSDLKNAMDKNIYSGFVAMLIDSEDPVNNPEEPWLHLKNRPGDGWEKPAGADDEQVLLMTTCQETWILADLWSKNGKPVTKELEKKDKETVKHELEKLTGGKYKKEHGIQFKFLEKVKPEHLTPLPSFARVRRILTEKLTA